MDSFRETSPHPGEAAVVHQLSFLLSPLGLVFDFNPFGLRSSVLVVDEDANEFSIMKRMAENTNNNDSVRSCPTRLLIFGASFIIVHSCTRYVYLPSPSYLEP